MSSRSLLPAYISVFSANVIYGINYALAKGIMPDFMQPRAIIFIRVSGSFIMFLIAQMIFVKERINRKDLPLFIFCSLFGIAINQIMFFEGLNLTTSINSAIIMTLTPILVMVFSAVMIKERITILKLIGITSGAAGAAMIILNRGDLSFNSDTLTGNIFTVINAASFGVYLVISKPLMVKYHPLTVMTWTFGIGLIMVTPVTILPFINTDFYKIPTDIWYSIGYVVVFATFLGYLFYNLAIRKLSATSTSSFVYLQPLFAGILAFFILGEKPGLVHLFSLLLIAGGVYIVNRHESKRQSVR